MERVSPSQAAMRIFIYLQIGEEGRAIADSLGEFAFRLRMFFDRIAASSLFTRSRSELHSARFARPHELASLISHTLTDTEALLLGVWNGNRPVSVKPSLSRPALGNLAVVARTRGGKGLLAKAQILSFSGSLVVNDIKGELLRGDRRFQVHNERRIRL